MRRWLDQQPSSRVFLVFLGVDAMLNKYARRILERMARGTQLFLLVFCLVWEPCSCGLPNESLRRNKLLPLMLANWKEGRSYQRARLQSLFQIRSSKLTLAGWNMTIVDGRYIDSFMVV